MTAQISSISDRFGHRVQLSEPMSHLEVHEIPTDESSTAGPIAVYTSFVVSPDDANPWVETWTALAAVVGTWPGCRIFRILRDRNDPMFMAAISDAELATRATGAKSRIVSKRSDLNRAGLVARNSLPNSSV